MVQEFNVLQCYSCRTFQVDQVKKSTNKWICKICNEKQSIKHVFFRGNGKDCRINCQHLNKKRHNKTLKENDCYLVDEEQKEEEDDEEGREQVLFEEKDKTSTDHVNKCKTLSGQSKWLYFVEKKMQEDEEPNDNAIKVKFRGEDGSKLKRKYKAVKERGNIKKPKVSTSSALRHSVNTKLNTFCSKSLQSGEHIIEDFPRLPMYSENCEQRSVSVIKAQSPNRTLAHEDGFRNSQVTSRQKTSSINAVADMKKMHTTDLLKEKQKNNVAHQKNSISSKWGKFLSATVDIEEEDSE